MVHDWILQQIDFGGVGLIPPRIKRPLYLHATVAMKMRKRGKMTNVSVKSNMPLLLHSFSIALALVALGLKPQQAISACMASLLSAKWNQAYSLTIMWLSCRLAYSLLRSPVMCIRGARSRISHYMSTTEY